MLRRKEKDRDEIATRIGDSSVGIITYDTEHRIGPISTDYGILFAVFSLMVIGSLMVFSASVSLSDSPKYATTETHFFIRHMISLAAALICGYVCWHIPMKVWREP